MRAWKGTAHVLATGIPTIVNSGAKLGGVNIEKAITGQTTKPSDVPAGEQIARPLANVRIGHSSPDTDLTNVGYGLGNKIHAADAGLTTALKNGGDVGKALAATQDARHIALERVAAVYQDAISRGLTSDQAQKVLLAGKVSKQDVAQIAGGYSEPVTLSSKTLKGMKPEQIQALKAAQSGATRRYFPTQP
jgi:hypothetical protein